jgi:hypothetical protein
MVEISADTGLHDPPSVHYANFPLILQFVVTYSLCPKLLVILAFLDTSLLLCTLIYIYV